MKRRFIYIITGVIAVGSVALVPVVVNAATTTSSTNTSSKLPKYTVREERLNAIAQVLNTTPQNLENSLKTESLKQIVTGTSLSTQQFKQKIRAQLFTDLENLGYSQSQITKFLNRHHDRV